MAEMSRVAQVLCRSGPWRVAARHVVLPWALQGIELHGGVLEIGCGSGAMASGLLHRFPEVRLTATDVDDAMVEAASRRLAGFATRADVRRADATALPFPDASFDGVVTFLMLHHVIDWEGALAEIARVLRPGGVLVGYDLVGGGSGSMINGKEHGTRRVQGSDLHDELARLRFTGIEVRRALAGAAVRFHGTRPA
jgi:SAM-dependent methyltransferase